MRHWLYSLLYGFTIGASISGAIFTLLNVAMGLSVTAIGIWTLLNLLVLGYLIHTGDPDGSSNDQDTR